MTTYEQVLAIALQTGDRPKETEAETGIGDALTDSGRPAEALHHYERAIKLAEDIGDRGELARAHERAGRAQCALGSREHARASWQRALELYAELGVPEADQVRELIDGLTP
jgi:tetratricopeptide (TPR) repeat protein